MFLEMNFFLLTDSNYFIASKYARNNLMDFSYAILKLVVITKLTLKSVHQEFVALCEFYACFRTLALEC